MKTNVLAATIIACALGVGACAHPSTPANAPSPAASSEATPASGSAASATAAAAGGAESSASSQGALVADNAGAPTEAQPTLKDDQILAITSAANKGEIEQGRLAMNKAHDARVKALAAAMVKDHTAAEEKGMVLAKKMGVTMTASPASESLQSAAENVTRSLKTESGTDFDKGYVDAQVNEHQDVLDTIDQKLLPNARNADLQAYLNDVRATVATHLVHAKDVQQALQK